MHWTEQYLGIPWLTGGRDLSVGLDCWGLLVHVYQKEYGITLPPFTEHVNIDFSHLLGLEREKGCWNPTDSPKDGDGVAVGRGVGFTHVGVYVEGMIPAILHSQVNTLSSIISVCAMRRTGWSNIQFYRHDLRS